MDSIRFSKNSFLILVFFFTQQATAQYTTNDVFADENETINMSRDIFVVWWDNDFDYTNEVDALLDQMIAYKAICINQLNMQNPPNPIDGYYFNVYLHGDGGYFDTNGWGNGVGTDSNGYPFFTLPYGSINDLINLSHETFHIFQYNATSSGFAYAGDSQWYIEGSANWFAATQYPNATRAFIEAESLVRIPHVPLWLSFENFPSTYPNNWQRFVHQYASAMLMYYLSEEKNVSHDIIVGGFYTNTTELPQEYLFNQIGGTNFRNYFLDWAAHMTNDFDFITPAQRAANLNEWNSYADPNDDNEYVETFTTAGSNGWYRPIETKTTTSWSFNTYKLENNETTNYTFELNGDELGSYGDVSFFQGKVLVKNTNGQSEFYDLQMTNSHQGSISIDVESSDSEIYFIIVSMPDVFEDVNAEFQQFSYEIQITNSALSTSDFEEHSNVKVYPNPFKEQLSIQFDTIQNDVVIALFSVTGQRLLEQNVQQKDLIEFNTSNLSNGFYFLRLSTDDINFQVIKIVK